MQPETTDPAQAQPEVEAAVEAPAAEEPHGQRWPWRLIVVTVIIGLGIGAFYVGFEFASETKLTIGDLLQFLRQLYQWFGSG